MTSIGSRLFGIDYRTLGLFRIGLGIILLTDIICRAKDLRAFYTDFGVLPRAAYIDQFMQKWAWSFHLMNGTTFFQALLFIVAGCFAVGLIMGYRTRLMTIGSWLFLISLQVRNPMVLQGGDIVIRMLLFWAIFLPTGTRFSLDAKTLDRNNSPPTSYFLNVGSVGLALQVAFIYWFTAILKWHPVWIKDYSALYFALNMDQLTTALGAFLSQFTTLLQVLTLSTLILEIIAPTLIFLPFKTGVIRLGVIGAMVGFHIIGIGTTFKIGFFPYVCALAWLSFLPRFFWENTRPGQRLEGGLDRVFSTLQAKFQLSLPTWTFKFYTSNWTRRFLVIILIYISLWNVRSVWFKQVEPFFPKSFNFFAHILNIHQYWNMFAPYPFKDDGWYVIEGRLADNSTVDLFNSGKPVNWDKPDYVSDLYRNQRWRKYMRNIWLKKNQDHRLYFGRFVTRRWNLDHSGDQELLGFKMYYMKEMTPEPGNWPESGTLEVEKVLIWTHQTYPD